MDSLVALANTPSVEEALEAVENRLRIEASSDHPLITEKLQHLVGAGGKRLRPMMAIASAMSCQPSNSLSPDTFDSTVLAAVIVEMIHVGSLYHDDVMDDADQRRGVASPNAKWGNLVAILSGDYLLARASELATTLGQDVASVLAKALRQLVHGQLLEFEHVHRLNRTVEEYYESIYGKTACLFGAACQIGALVAGASLPVAEALAKFGDSIGMAFQICDDISDMTSTTTLLGKPAGTDMGRGNYTLPVLMTLQDKSAAPVLLDLLNSGHSSLTAAQEYVRGSGGIHGSVLVAKQFTNEAITSLESLSSSGITEHLRSLATELVDSLVTL